MKKNKSKTSKKKSSVAQKTGKSPAKAIRKILKKIKDTGKKIPVRPRVSKKPSSLQNLVLKDTFVKPFQTLSHTSPAPMTDRRLPPYYAEDRLVLLVRDPWWIYGYWEVTPGREAQIMHDIYKSGLYRDKTVLRVYDVTGTAIDAPNGFFDIEIHHLNSNWYIDVGSPDRDWIAEIGIRTRDGRFFMMVRSNVVKTPPFGISDVLDEEWMMPDDMYYKLLGIMGGFESVGDSMSVRKMVERYVRQTISSETVPQLSKAKPVS